MRSTDYTTKDDTYAQRLLYKESAWWKKFLDVQMPYRWNLRKLEPGFTLDIGCGLGRNLINLNGNGVGIDHNASSIQITRSRGLITYTPDEFSHSEYNKVSSFDSILMSHVAEHMTLDQTVDLIESYIHLLKPNGKLILITPQEYGFRSDPTHIQFMGFEELESILKRLKFTCYQKYSFPFPRFFGNLFKYNEFVVVGTVVLATHT
jgi:SAM-dependent methyltransferase